MTSLSFLARRFFNMEEKHFNELTSDDEVDSDIEAYLYSQLHYSAELNLDSDSELVIEKQDLSEEEKLPDIIDISNEKSKTESKDLWAIHEKDLKGADAYLESFGRNKRYYLGNQQSNFNCHNCNQRGHSYKQCPEAPKEETCHLCGLKGHLRRSCPNDVCYNCYEIGHIAKTCNMQKKNNYAVCKRCWGRGHNVFNCPEIWRQYHLTIKDVGTITKPKFDENGVLKSMRKVRYCFNCGEKGHFGHDCKQERPSRRPVNSPFTVNYDQCPFKSKNANKLNSEEQRRVDQGEWKRDDDTRKFKVREEISSRGKDERKRESYAVGDNWHGRQDGKQREAERHRSHRDIDRHLYSSASQRLDADAHFGSESKDYSDTERQGNRQRGSYSERFLDSKDHIRTTKGYREDEHSRTAHAEVGDKDRYKERRSETFSRERSSRREDARRRDDSRRDHDSRRGDASRKEDAYRREDAYRKEHISKREDFGRRENASRREDASKRGHVLRGDDKPKGYDVCRKESVRQEHHERSSRGKFDAFVDSRNIELGKIILTDDDEEKGKRKEKKDRSFIYISSDANENEEKQSKTAVKLKRDKATDRGRGGHETECHPRKRKWEESASAEDNNVGRAEKPFKIVRSSEVIEQDNNGEYEFIDIDIYAESDSSLEMETGHEVAGDAKKSNEERPCENAGKKDVQDCKDTGEAVMNKDFEWQVDEESCRGTKDSQKAKDAKSSKQSSEQPSKERSKHPSGTNERGLTVASNDGGESASKKGNGLSNKSCKVVGSEGDEPKKDDKEKQNDYSVNKPSLEKVDEGNLRRTDSSITCSQVKGKVQKQVRSDNSESKVGPKNPNADGIGEGTVASSTKNSFKIPTDDKMRSKGTDSVGLGRVNEDKMGRNIVRVDLTEIEARNLSEYNEVNKNEKSKSKAASDLANDAAGIITSGNRSEALPILSVDSEKSSASQSHDVELRFFFDKSKEKVAKEKADQHRRKIVKESEDTAVSRKGVLDSNESNTTCSQSPSVALPDFITLTSADEKTDEIDNDPNRVYFVDDDDDASSGGKDDDANVYSSDAENFQFSNMLLDQDSSSEDDLRSKIDSLKSKRVVRPSTATRDPTEDFVEEYATDDVENSYEDTNSMFTVMESPVGDRREVDLTRYDPSKSNDDDAAAYKSYAEFVGKKHQSLQPLDRAKRNVFMDSKETQSNFIPLVRNTNTEIDLESPNESRKSSKKRNITKGQRTSTPVVVPTEWEMWQARTASTIGSEAFTPLNNRNKATRLVSRTVNRKVAKNWNGNKKSNIPQTEDFTIDKQSYLDELKGKGKKARKSLKRKWREAIFKNGGPDWLKKLSNFNDHVNQMDAVKEGRVEDGEEKEAGEKEGGDREREGRDDSGIVVVPNRQQLVRKVSRIVKRRGKNSTKGKGKRVVNIEEVTPIQTNAGRRIQRKQQKAGKLNFRINRGFRHSDTAKNFAFNDYL